MLRSDWLKLVGGVKVNGLANFFLPEVQILKEGKTEDLIERYTLISLVLEDLICKRPFYGHDTIPVPCKKLIPKNPTQRLSIDKKHIRSYQISSVCCNVQGKQFTYCGYKVERSRSGCDVTVPLLQLRDAMDETGSHFETPSKDHFVWCLSVRPSVHVSVCLSVR